MAVTPEKPGPYAPGATVLQVIERHRSRGLPSPITAEVLGRAGVSDSLQPRVLQALQTLDLIGEGGEITPTFEGIQRAPEDQYKARLLEWLNAAYADVLRFIDPATATETQVRDAFRSYNPVGQQPRMVSLFFALYAAAGARPEKAPGQPRAPAARVARPAKPFVRGPIYKTSMKAAPAAASGLPAPLTALLADLPAQGGRWTQQRRDKFLGMFESMLDYYYNIGDELPADTDDEEAA